jgi:hypothetical protein
MLTNTCIFFAVVLHNSKILPNIASLNRDTMYIQDNELERILRALKSISPSPEQLPCIPVNTEYQLGMYIGTVNVVIQHLEELIEKR